MHVTSIKTYSLVLAALFGLLLLAIVAAWIPHGATNLVVALTISAAKMALILMFFMHLSHEHPVIRLAAVAGYLWLALLLGLTMGDYLTRPTITADTVESHNSPSSPRVPGERGPEPPVTH